MLYGNLIFIKKTGGDGSKYPVTERDIKIGRSENCLIRIYNPHVALEHCQLIIEDNGQATLRNLSNQSIFNSNNKSLSNRDVTLCHGDVFKLGERLARWEYLPTSKFHKQVLSPTGRLVAVVMPQQRSSEAEAETSASGVSVLKNITLGKRRFSERFTSENSSSVKIKKSNGSELIHKGKGDLQKLCTGQHNLKSPKWVTKGGKVKERKSISGIVGLKTSKGKVGEKHRKSTLPSWKVNIVSPSERKSSRIRDSFTRSNQKSEKMLNDSVQILLKDTIISKPEKLLPLESRTEVKEPQNIHLNSKSLDDTVKTVLKKSVVTENKLPLNFNDRSTRSTHSLSQSLERTTLNSPSKIVLSTPKQMSSVKFGRLVHSESKITSKKHPVFFKKSRKMSLILNKMNTTPKENLNRRSIAQKKRKISEIKMSDISNKTVLTPAKNNETVKAEKKEISCKLSKNAVMKSTPKKSIKTPRKSVLIKTPKSLTRKQSKTPKISTSEKVSFNTESQTPSVIDLDDTKKSKDKFVYQKSFTAEAFTSKKTPVNSSKSPRKTKLPSSKIQNEIVSSVSSPVEKNSHPFPVKSTQSLTSPRSRHSLIATSRTSSLKKGTVFQGRGQRRLSSSASAERAAKELKTSCPRKPDKNKKAALLVLGKASRKHQILQNVKVLLRQKILKKAIKHSTAISALDDKIGIKVANKLKKNYKKNTSKSKSKKLRIKNDLSENSLPPKYLKKSNKTDVKSPIEEKVQGGTPKSKKVVDTEVLQTPPRLSSDATVQSVSKRIKQSEFSHSDNSDSFIQKKNSPSSPFERSAEHYFVSSNRRCSKRLSYKNDTGRPDFIELTPTALGLIPKNVGVFKTSKDNKRRSSSLVTPKNVKTTGIIKSASTSRIGDRKSVRFSSKDASKFCSLNDSERIDVDFSPFDSPNITVDVFVSPLMEQSAVIKQNLNESMVTSGVKENSCKSNSVSKMVSQKLQTPASRKKLNNIFLNSSKLISSSSASTSKLLSSVKIEEVLKAPDESKSRKSGFSDLIDPVHYFSTPKSQKSPRNSLSDVTEIRRLLGTPKDKKSFKNDLTDVRGVKKLMRTPELQKSPKNDLTDVKGVKKLMRTPKLQKSPKNDLTDVRGVKKLMRTPKLQKSPKNDLTDLRGVKKLMGTPKLQKSPKNDLTDLRGVKKLMGTPKLQKSPKNDLTDVRGVKKLMGTPKLQKSPKNDLTDVRGVKKLMGTPKLQKSPKNDLTDVRGVKKLMGTPKLQKSPKNDLTDVRGVKKLMGTPKLQKSPKNDLTDVRGVKRLMRTPKNNLSDIRGGKKLLTALVSPESSLNSVLEVREIKKPLKSFVVQQGAEDSIGLKILPSRSEKDLNVSVMKAKVKQLLVSTSLEGNLKSGKTDKKKSHVKDFRAIRGRRSIYSRSKGLKDDLSDLIGLRELFSRHKPTSDYNRSLIGVAELFELPKTEVAFEQNLDSRKEIMPEAVQKVLRVRTVKLKNLKNEIETKRSTRLRLKKAIEEIEKPAKRKKMEAVTNIQEEEAIKKKTDGKTKVSRGKKNLETVTKLQKVVKKETKTSVKKSSAKAKVKCLEEDQREKSSCRKRKILEEDIGISPPKRRKKVPASEKSTSNKVVETFKMAISKPRTEGATRKKTSQKSVKKVSEKAKSSEAAIVTSEVQIKGANKTGTKKILKVQNKRSQSTSKKNLLSHEEKESSRKTRNNKVTISTKKITDTQLKTTEKKLRSTARKEKLFPVVRRSARRK